MSETKSASAPGGPTYVPIDKTALCWLDFDWVPDTTEPAPPFTVLCGSNINGTAEAHANGTGADAIAYDSATLQGAYLSGSAHSASASFPDRPTDTDNSNPIVFNELSGGYGGNNAVRLELTLGVTGRAGASATAPATATSTMASGYSVTVTLHEIP